MNAPERKVLMLILDGLGDLPIAALDGRTPLEAAKTPVMDGWVADGRCGLVDPVEPGVTVETHAGTGTLMGLSTADAAALARGPVEAAGAGLDLKEGDIALRCNFAAVERENGALVIRDRRAGRILDGTVELAQAVNAIPPEDGITTFLAPLHQHRAVLRLSGAGLSAEITDTDPGESGHPQHVRRSRALREGDAAAERAAAALNRFATRAHEILDGHEANRARAERGLPPANAVLARGAGMVAAIDSLVVRLGLRGAVVAGDRTVLGLGALLGFTPVVEPAFTALPDTDLDAKVAAALRALQDDDIVWLHVKGSDIAAHDRNPTLKRDVLERLDVALAPLVGTDLAVGVTADHTTDSNTGRHASDPVPTLLHVPGGPRDEATRFGERACMRGGLGRLRAPEFLRVVLEAAGRSPNAPDGLPPASGDELPDAARSREDLV